MTNIKWPGAAFAVGPLCMTVYGLIRLTDDVHGPGFAWSASHLALLAGVLAFVPVFLRLRRSAARGRGAAGRWFAGAAAAAGLLGVVAVTAQAVIDLVVGFLSEDRGAMNDLFQRVQDQPGVMPAVYTVGPVLFYVGLVLLTVWLAALRRTEAWRPAVIVAGVAVMAVSLDLLPLGGLLFLLALAPLGRRAPDRAGRLTARTRSPHDQGVRGA
ncbi:hypothetical protein ACIGQE_09515 [Streptomyces sp. NPDC053429]|uniref:hypothetical protein n=1 Tax=Streptomyces sp. NPDC053429 TaxID=3365702 RepID=UPI0037D27181